MGTLHPNWLFWKARRVEPVRRCQRLKSPISFRLWLPRTVWYPTLLRLWTARGCLVSTHHFRQGSFLTLPYLWCQVVFLSFLCTSLPVPLVVVNYTSGDFNPKWSFLVTCFVWKGIHCLGCVLRFNCEGLHSCSKIDLWKKSFVYLEELKA